MSYYHAIEKIEASLQEELQEMYELLDPRNKGSPVDTQASLTPTDSSMP